MPRKPWADEELVNLFEHRDSAFQDYLRSSKEEDNAHFKMIGNMVNSLKRKKTDSITRLFLRKIKRDPKRT